MTKPIQYHRGQVINEKGAIFIEEVPSDNKRRKAKFLCGECKTNTFIALIENVKRIKKPQFRCKECSRKHGHVRDEKGRSVVDNLLGRRFGYLVVIKYLGSVCNNKHQLWLCQCDCGRLREVRANNLKTGHTKSCGVCHISLGEAKVEEELQKQEVKYIPQYIFPDCKKTKPLRFDFYLPEYNCCIEYDGKQHYGIKGTWYENHKDDYYAQQERDKIKTEYCIKHKIPLYRISYLEYNIIEKRIKEILKEVKKMMVKNIAYRSFTHVEKLQDGKVNVSDFLDSDNIYIFPKIDGTSSLVWASQGKIHCGSRKREIDTKNDNANFCKYIMNSQDAQIAALRQFCLDNEGLIVYGEFIGHVPETSKFVGSIKTYIEGGFFIFAIFDIKRGIYVPYSDYGHILKSFYDKTLTPIAILSHPSLSDIVPLMDKNNYNLPANQFGEGIVIYNYDYKDKYGHPFIGKMVREDFLNSKSRKSKANAAKAAGETEREFVEAYCTISEISKAQAKIMVEMGVDEWTNDKALIGRTMNEVVTSVIEDNLVDFVLKKKMKVDISFGNVRNLINQKVRDYLGL